MAARLLRAGRAVSSLDGTHAGDDALAKNQNTFEKRRREMEKKRKAEAKRERRRSKNVEPNVRVEETSATELNREN